MLDAGEGGSPEPNEDPGLTAWPRCSPNPVFVVGSRSPADSSPVTCSVESESKCSPLWSFHFCVNDPSAPTPVRPVAGASGGQDCAVTARAHQPSMKWGDLMGNRPLPKSDAPRADGRGFWAPVIQHVMRSEDVPGQQNGGGPQSECAAAGSTCVCHSPAPRPAGVSWPLFAGAAPARFPPTGGLGLARGPLGQLFQAGPLSAPRPAPQPIPRATGRHRKEDSLM